MAVAAPSLKRDGVIKAQAANEMRRGLTQTAPQPHPIDAGNRDRSLLASRAFFNQEKTSSNASTRMSGLVETDLAGRQHCDSAAGAT